MTTIEITQPCCERPTLRLAIPVPGILSAFVRWQRERRTLARVARFSEHLMRDVGLDPDEVYDAVPGRWEEVHPGHYRVH